MNRIKKTGPAENPKNPTKPTPEQQNLLLTEGNWSSEEARKIFQKMRDGEWAALSQILRDGYKNYQFPASGDGDFEAQKETGIKSWISERLEHMKQGIAVAACHLKYDLSEKWKTDKTYLDFITEGEYRKAEETGKETFVQNKMESAAMGNPLAFDDLLRIERCWGKLKVSPEENLEELRKFLPESINTIQKRGIVADVLKRVRQEGSSFSEEIARSILQNWKVTNENQIPKDDDVSSKQIGWWGDKDRDLVEAFESMEKEKKEKEVARQEGN